MTFYLRITRRLPLHLKPTQTLEREAMEKGYRLSRELAGHVDCPSYKPDDVCSGPINVACGLCTKHCYATCPKKPADPEKESHGQEAN